MQSGQKKQVKSFNWIIILGKKTQYRTWTAVELHPHRNVRVPCHYRKTDESCSDWRVKAM